MTMGTPSNNESSDLLARVMAHPGRKLSEAELRKAGVDAKVLKNIFDADIKPQLKDISLKPFGETHSDGIDELLSTSLVSGKLAQYRGTPSVMVLDLKFGLQDSTDTLSLKLWLMRNGDWAIWFARAPEVSDDLETSNHVSEQSHRFDSIDALLEFLQENVPAVAYRLGSRERHIGKGFPYLIIASFGEILAVEEERRQKRLELLRKSKDSIGAALQLVAFDAH